MKIFNRPWENGNLKVTENGHYFSCGEKPFFWMADTAWLLFHRLTLEETYQYLRNRREKGYNVILADFIHKPDQKNLAGDSAMENENFLQINETGGFWSHIDKVVEMAQELGLYMGILPVWGSILVKKGYLNEDNLEHYMNFILNRYHKYSNIIWIVGGDVRGDVSPSVFEAMGRRMKQDCPERLVGYHPFGRTCSSLWFHNAEWLDFNLYQSGHRRYDQKNMGTWDDNLEAEGNFGEDCWRYAKRAYSQKPIKPVLDGEPSYEWILQGLEDKKQPYWMSADVRRYAYWNVFAGAAGHTYGHNSVMQFYREGTALGAYGVKQFWSEAIHHPGCAEMKHLVRLMESVDFVNGRPAQELLLSEQGEKYDRISIFAGKEFLFAYSFKRRELSVSLKEYAGRNLAAYWMDPVTGDISYIMNVTDRSEITLTPPEREDSEDVVLVIRTEEN